jgi:hypothetical protein
VTLRPKTPNDLLLAPVAAEVDRDLQPLRDTPPAEIAEAPAIALDVDAPSRTAPDRVPYRR